MHLGTIKSVQKKSYIVVMDQVPITRNNFCIFDDFFFQSRIRQMPQCHTVNNHKTQKIGKKQRKALFNLP